MKEETIKKERSFIRGRREERKDDRQLGRPGGGGNHYQMRQKMVAIGDDFWIENDKVQKVYKYGCRDLVSIRKIQKK
jgi:hypothetical protein